MSSTMRPAARREHAAIPAPRPEPQATQGPAAARGGMTIGEASRASGVSAKMIRHYEQLGLLSPAPRTEGGYRLYGPSDVRTLRFILRARNLGFPLEKVQELLELWRDRARPSARVKALALEHVRQIEAKAAELQSMSRALRHLAEQCHGDHRPDCPILEDLEEGPR